MKFLILGPLEVHDERGPVALGGIKPRAVLAVLLLHPNESVSAERLSLALWGEDAPASWAKTVQVYVSRLRKALGDADALLTTQAGYRLRVREDELDAERFARLVEDGRRELAAGRGERAAAVMREALALWRGPALDDLAFEPFAQVEIARLEEQRVAALEVRVDADLATGRHVMLVGELRRLVSASPTRERFVQQLMLALYRCGRQADALAAYHEARRLLLAELGIEPGPELRRLQEAILRHDASLEARGDAPVLPEELDAAASSPLVGRGAELVRLRDHWVHAQSGRGSLITLIGVRGAGKSRLAAELAGEVHARGGRVGFVDGTGRAEQVMMALARAREATRPELLVVDHADRAGPDALAALAEAARVLSGVPVLLLASGEAPEALAHLEARDTLMLGPLDTDAVRAISARYASGRAAAGVPADELWEASAGIPGRIHEVAGEWARREAVGRVSVVAGRAAAGRTRLRSMELELAGELVDLQAARERGAAADDGEAAVLCPFKGLAAFDVADAPYFFGRERLVAQLVARLVGAPMLAIVGPSGSGKSSVLRAGLLPALGGGVLPGSEQWTQTIIRPGEHPLRELDAARVELGGGQRLVLAVDQFEETFTTCGDERERAAFISELVRLANEGLVTVVLVVRADYYGRCVTYPDLSGLLAANHVLVGPMRRDELRRVVSCPAQRAGLRVEPELHDALLADIEDAPGALPLLSAALLELWQLRDGRRLRYSAYEQTGGVRGAVARLAEHAFTPLDDRRQAVARDLFMRLVGLGADGEAERRRVALTELATDERRDVASVLELFTDRRLLTISTGTVEVAHEALLREWPRLAGWIDESRDELRTARGLGSAAQEWQRVSHDEGVLYRGARLAETLDWRAARAPPLSALEREFLAASEAGQARERAARQRRIRLRGAALATLAAAFIGIVVTLLFADRERDVAASRDLASRSSRLLATDPGLALAIALEALRRRNTTPAQNALRQATLAHRETRVVDAHDGLAFAVAVSRDGRHAATAGSDRAVRIWSLATGRRVGQIRGYRDEVRAVGFSRDGRLIASSARDGEIAVAPATGGSRKVVARLHDDFATSIEFGAADGTLALGTDGGRVAGVRLRDRRLSDLTAANPDGVLAVRFDRDARRIVSVGYQGFARVSTVADDRRLELAHGEQHVIDGAFSPGGGRVATVDAAGALRLWNASSGGLTARIQIGDEPLASVRFSEDGRRIVTGGFDGAISVLTVYGGGALGELRGHRGQVRADFVPGAGSIVSAGEEDGTLRTWSPPAARVSARPGTAPRFTDDGKLVISGDPAGPIHVWNPATGRHRELHGPAYESYPQPAETPGQIVSAYDDGTVRLWDADDAEGRAVPTLPGQKLAVAIEPTGKRLAIGGQTPLVIQAADGRDRITLRGPGVRVNALAFSPDGRYLLSGADDEIVRVWNARSGALERALRGHKGIVRGVAYSDDGRLIASAGSDGTVRVWPADGGDPVVLVGHESAVNTARFDAAGERLVSAGDDGTVRVWDVDGGETLVVLHRYQGVAAGADFGIGHEVVSSGDGITRSTPCEVCGDLEDVLRIARALPQRMLSAAERRQLLSAG